MGGAQRPLTGAIEAKPLDGLKIPEVTAPECSLGFSFGFPVLAISQRVSPLRSTVMPAPSEGV